MPHLSLRRRPRPLRRVSLRTKLVAAALTLVTAALLVIGATSAVLLRQYLVGRVDKQLQLAASTVDYAAINGGRFDMGISNDWFVQETNPQGVGGPPYAGRYKPRDLPPLTTGLTNVNRVNGHPFTVVAPSGVRWRMLVTVLPSNTVLHLAESLSSVDETMGRFVVTEMLVGTSVLLLLGVVAAGLVRFGLRPLVQIEQTAEAIAGGDLTRRVPDLEPGVDEPQTEMGRLGLALNTMLGQIETAFTAREESERAARNAEAVAREAADKAQVSEVRARRSEEKMRQFVADASHELRTPLTTIRGFAELYRQGAAREPGQVESLVKRIEDEASRMGLLVEDLLLLARMDEERPLHRAPVELRVLAVDAVSAARAVAPDREVDAGGGAGYRAADRTRRRATAAAGDREPDDQRAHPHPGRYAGRCCACGNRSGRGTGGRRLRAGPLARSRPSGYSSGSTGWTRRVPGGRRADGTRRRQWHRPGAGYRGRAGGGARWHGRAWRPRPGRARHSGFCCRRGASRPRIVRFAGTFSQLTRSGNPEMAERGG